MISTDKSAVSTPDSDSLSGRHFAAIIESTHDAIISKSLEGIIQSWNPAAENIFGYTAAEAIGQPMTMLIPEERHGEELDILARIRRGENIDHYETVRKRKDGSLVNISLTVSPIRDATGKIIGASKIARDSTPQKKVEELQSHFAAIVESSDDAILSKDLNGIIQSWNRGAQSIFGYTATEAIGKPVTMLIPEGHQDEEPHILARIRRGEKIDHYETERIRKDGSRVNISLTVSPIKDATGKIIGASKIARDVTEQKSIERKMRKAQAELATLNDELERRVSERTASLKEAINQLEEFSYSVSHDLRSPTRAMEAYAKAVIEDYGSLLDERGRDYLQKIVRSSARMDRLIQDLLTYTRVLRSDMCLEPIELAPLLRDILDQYPEMQPPHAQITFPDELGAVMAHEASLTQILSNLLSNAVKFVSPQTIPQVEIRSERRKGKVRLWIADNGIGIKPELQSRLFGMFERIHPELRYEGTGIGLAIARKAIERMGGAVGVESDGVAGASFWIELASAPTQHA